MAAHGSFATTSGGHTALNSGSAIGHDWFPSRTSISMLISKLARGVAAAGPHEKEDQCRPGGAEKIQARFRRRRRQSVRLGRGVAHDEDRQAGSDQARQWRKSTGPWRHADPRRRRVGAFLLHRLPQSASGLSKGVCRSPGELGICRPAVREALILFTAYGTNERQHPAAALFI